MSPLKLANITSAFKKDARILKKIIDLIMDKILPKYQCAVGNMYRAQEW